MRLKPVLLGVMLLGLPAVVHAQTTACPAGKQINANKLFIGTAPMADGSCTVPSGDAVAALAAAATNASNLTAGTVPAGRLVNRPIIPALTNTVGSSATTIYPAGSYFSIFIKVTTPGASAVCTGDGGATYGTAFYPQDLHWPAVPGGAMPPGPVVCTGPTTIAPEAH